MFRFAIQLPLLFLLTGCFSEKETVSVAPSEIEFRLTESGTFGIDFYDKSHRIHIANMSTPCVMSSCSKGLFSVIHGEEIAGLLDNPLIPFEVKLKEFGRKINQQVSTHNLLVEIGVVNTPRNTDVVGIVTSILENYAFLQFGTVEVSTLPIDSVSIPINSAWKLVRDTVEFRHVSYSRVRTYVKR